MSKKPTIKQTNKSQKLDLVVRSLEKQVEPKSAQAGTSCARVYCL